MHHPSGLLTDADKVSCQMREDRSLRKPYVVDPLVRGIQSRKTRTLWQPCRIRRTTSGVGAGETGKRKPAIVMLMYIRQREKRIFDVTCRYEILVGGVGFDRCQAASTTAAAEFSGRIPLQGSLQAL